jgi:hypothetical protein
MNSGNKPYQNNNNAILVKSAWFWLNSNDTDFLKIKSSDNKNCHAHSMNKITKLSVLWKYQLFSIGKNGIIPLSL